MSRLLVVACGLMSVSVARGQCVPWYPAYPVRPVYGPVYPLSPAIWGAPAPKPLPPAPVPKRAAVREELDTAPPKPDDRPKNGTKPKEADVKEDATPRIQKTKLPLPGDPTEPEPSAGKPPAEKKEPPKADRPEKAEPRADREKAFDQFLVPAQGGRGEPKAEVKVGFFNHSDRDVVLDVNGETVRLPSEQYVTLRLPRTFKWAEKGQKGTDVAVPPDADGIEIVFRK